MLSCCLFWDGRLIKSEFSVFFSNIFFIHVSLNIQTEVAQLWLNNMK